jgi:hypothetical protein
MIGAAGWVLPFVIGAVAGAVLAVAALLASLLSVHAHLQRKEQKLDQKDNGQLRFIHDVVLKLLCVVYLLCLLIVFVV